MAFEESQTPGSISMLSSNSSSSRTLDLSRRNFTEIPEEISWFPCLENLYLEGNQLTALPDCLFSNAPNLKWLDLRNNQLKILPPAIEKLRSLRTLLLEGNQLVSLPVQLCRLPLLTGLNISRNPLKTPPRDVIEKGTKAVLTYLREMLSDEEMTSSDSSSSLPDSGDGSSTYYIPLKPIAGTTSQVGKPSVRLPVPAMKPATLHSMEYAQKTTYSPPPHAQRARSKPAQKKAEINRSLDKLKSKQGLEEWRNKAKLKQLQDSQTQHLPQIPNQPPYATEVQISQKPEPQIEEDSTSLEYKLGAGLDQRKVDKYKSRLAEKRKQVGIIKRPSTDLQQAERCLAEAMAMQEELETRKDKEYRLTAFTGDLPY